MLKAKLYPRIYQLNYILTIFLSAFLIFFIQPLLAKSLLPSFGGSIFVWVVSMLFFQAGLLLGYGYAYFLSGYRIIHQVLIHGLLLTLSFYFIDQQLPALPNSSLISWPPLTLLGLLCAKILLPFSLLCSTSPLLQSWYCKIKKTDFPYYFYAISNAGSLIGLFCFPFFFELWLDLDKQIIVWNGLYVLFVVGCIFCALPLLRKTSTQVVNVVKTYPNCQKVSKWLGLTILSNALMLSTTNYILQNIINMPLIWVLPLALFLVSFIVTFSSEKKYHRAFWMLSTIIWTIILSYAIYTSATTQNFFISSLLVLMLLYSGCMVCHGELILLKPETEHLTFFYLIIALGGVLGGLFVTFGGYWLFHDLWEYYLPIITIVLFCTIMLYKAYTKKSNFFNLFSAATGLFTAVYFIYVIMTPLFNVDFNLVTKDRSAYGIITVKDYMSKKHPIQNARQLIHGPILHGFQYINPKKSLQPTSYYTKEAGVGYAFEFLRHTSITPLKVGVIGLGAGTIAAFGEKGDHFDFFDIDKKMIDISQKYFSYVKNSPSKQNIILGDGRIQMQNLLKESGSQNYDLIVVDAFSGDSIPFHLITQEALSIYRQHLKAKGLIAFHISNKFINLKPITKALADEYSFLHFVVTSPENTKIGANAATWVIISGNIELAVWLHQNYPDTARLDKNIKPILWTDKKNSMMPLIIIDMSQL